MGDKGVGSMLLLADTATSVQRFVSVFVGVYVLLIFAYIIASWVPAGGSPTLERGRQFLYDVCEPYLRIFRRDDQHFLRGLDEIERSAVQHEHRHARGLAG